MSYTRIGVDLAIPTIEGKPVTRRFPALPVAIGNDGIGIHDMLSDGVGGDNVEKRATNSPAPNLGATIEKPRAVQQEIEKAEKTHTHLAKACSGNKSGDRSGTKRGGRPWRLHNPL